MEIADIFISNRNRDVCNGHFGMCQKISGLGKSLVLQKNGIVFAGETFDFTGEKIQIIM